MRTESLPADYPNAISHAVDVLCHGGLVAFPTDTVYGLASLPFDGEIVERLYIAKGRNSEKAIAILLGEEAQLAQIAEQMGESAVKLAKKFWPGPLTLIVPRHPGLPDILSTRNTIGVRMPDHPVALTLLKQTGPLAVTSANLSGRGNATTAQEVHNQLNGRIHLILDGGRTPGGVPSTVVDCTSAELVVLREGPISIHQIKSALA